MNDPERREKPKGLSPDDFTPGSLKTTLEQRILWEEACVDMYWEVASLLNTKGDRDAHRSTHALLVADGGDGKSVERLLMERYLEGEEIADLAREII